MPEVSDAPDNAAALTGATLFAMTRFVEAPCPELAGLVARHLECVADDETSDARLRDICGALATRWRGWIVAHVSLKADAARH